MPRFQLLDWLLVFAGSMLILLGAYLGTPGFDWMKWCGGGFIVVAVIHADATRRNDPKS
ncbi:hypothetical protein OH802_04165 [Nocardioides sp. NBC_00850]|uniref:hypothetical protein n=1 Tax=Nocardioides sp. NBC_00850 TaxID=2976001 RepID=UPI003867FE0F|nr:hypothetical protein OH802_04165 [Nocardioides sp. NBC_00850]